MFSKQHGEPEIGERFVGIIVRPKLGKCLVSSIVSKKLARI